MPAGCILLVSADPKGLAAMAAALAGHFPVLTARDAATALGLVARHGPCDAAFCEVSSDAAATVKLAERLVRASPGIAVTALCRPPCPDSLGRALANGVISRVCPLPISPDVLRQTARRVLNARHGRELPPDAPAGGILTQEEVAFLLGHDSVVAWSAPHRHP